MIAARALELEPARVASAWRAALTAFEVTLIPIAFYAVVLVTHGACAP